MRNVPDKNAREAAFLAILSSLRGNSFAKDSLARWAGESHPASSDFRLAQEIAYGTIRMSAALDHQALHLTTKKKVIP